MMMLLGSLRTIRMLALVCLAIVLLATTATAQQKILWQGAVMPERINVYASTSTRDRVSTTLKQGDVVDVVLEINALGDAWCRVAFSGQSEPLGYVFCHHLQQGHFTPKQSAHSEPAATQSHAQVLAISTTQKLTEAAVVNPAVLTNKDVLDMNKIGLAPEVLVAKIKSSQRNFDTSPASLQALKTAGVRDNVILAMVEAPAGQPKPARVADPPNVASASTPQPPTTVPSNGKARVFVTDSQKMDPIRVFVFTAADPGGFVDSNLKQRSDSVEDLKKDLSKNSVIQIVSQQAGADVTLEVLGRGDRETGGTSTFYGYDGQWHTYADTVRVVRVGLRAGTYTRLFEGTSSFAQRGLVGVSQGLWRVAASGAAKGIENWIRANHDNLISRR
jgi:hypothetical protein